MARHFQSNRGCKLVLLLIVCVFAVFASAERSSTGGFLPRKSLTQNVKSDATNNVVRKNDLISSPGFGTTRGGAISIPHPTTPEIKGTVAFIVLDILFRKAFKAKGITFPSQLGGCCILFVTMLLANVIKPGLGDAVFAYLTPGALLLAKWIPVFFVPGLAMLPLAPSMGNTTEILKVLFIVVAGFYYSCATTAYAVLGLRKMEGSDTSAATPVASSNDGGPKPKPFSTNLVNVLGQGLVLTGALSIGAAKLGKDDIATPLNAAFMLFTTFYGYVWGARLHPSFVKIIHPLVTSTVVTLALTQLVALLMGGDFNSSLSTYKVGSMSLMKAGAGDVLLYLLGPSVVSFAISIYSRKKVIADNILTVFTSMMVGSIGGLFGTAFMVRLLQLGGEVGSTVLRKSMLPRNITTPLAIAITNIIGGDIAQACAVVVLTGIYGATFGQRFLNSLGITDPVSRGLGMGASAQGLGVATMMSEAEAFPFAAVSMVLTAMTATTLVSIPAFANAVVGVATGN